MSDNMVLDAYFNGMSYNELKQFDPVATAEKICAENAEVDAATLALQLAFAANRHLRARAEILADTHTAMSADAFKELLNKNGFVLVHEHSFESARDGIEKDYYYIYAEKKHGFLLTFDTYGKSVNGGQMHFSMKLADPDGHPDYGISYCHLWSGVRTGWGEPLGIINGHVDIRSGLFSFIHGSLEEGNEFLPIWAQSEYVRLLDYSEWHRVGEDINTCPGKTDRADLITTERFLHLPEWVQEMMRNDIDPPRIIPPGAKPRKL